MHKFKDAKGREWRLTLTIGHIKPIEAETGVNLLKIDKPFKQDSEDYRDDDGQPLRLLVRLQLDLELLFAVIFAAVMKQADEEGVDELEFGESMEGEAHVAAHNAFWAELKDFFLNARRTDQAAMVQKASAAIQRGIQAATEKANEIDLEKIVNKTFGK